MIGYFNYTVYATYLGTASGIVGIFFALQGMPDRAIFCLLVAGLFDMFDGKIARTRERTDSERRFGIQIDSLSDLICFGVLPATIGYAFGLNEYWYIAIMVLYVLCALIRLAFYNVNEEERQNTEKNRARMFYDGLPVTSVALLLPLVRCITIMINDQYMPIVYAASCAVIAILFITKIKVPKPGMRALIVLSVFGAAEFFMLLKLIK